MGSMTPHNQETGPPGPPGTSSAWGRVLDAAGNPLPDARVYWVDASRAGTRAVSWLHAHPVAHTDESGTFFAQDLPPGPCILVPDFKGMGVVGETLRIDRGNLVTLPTAGEDLLLRFPVTPRNFGHVHGTVRDPEGNPVAGLPLGLAVPDRGDDYQVTTGTGDRGEFAFPLLLPGDYLILVPATLHHLGGASPVEVRGGRQEKVGIGLHRRPPGGPTYSVEIRVEDPLGAPVAGARVDIKAPGHFFPPIPTGEDGVARAQGLPVRPVAAGVLAPGFRPMGLGWPGETDETEFGGTLSLHRVARCRVLVVDAATDRPLRNANIHLVHDGNNGWKWTGMPFPDTDAQEFDVVPGEVTIQVECPGYRPHESMETVLLYGPEDPIVVRLHRGGHDAPAA
jgi:hypothetical protein